jgi:hypothetical protein
MTMKKLLCFLWIALLAVSDSACFATTLFGGATHAEYLPPVSQQRTVPAPTFSSETPSADRIVRPGAAPSVASPQIYWQKLAPWMGGVWKKRGDMTVQVTDPRTGITSPTNEWTDDEMTITFGHIRDAEGNIWHAYLIPSERDGRSSGQVVRFVTVEFQGQWQPPNVVSRARYLISEASDPSNLRFLYQEESLNEYSSISETEMQNYSSDKMFDYEGRPVRQGLLVSRFKRVKPFTPAQEENGIPLMPSFKAYLTSQGLENLIPK